MKLFDFAALCRGLFLKSKRGLLGRVWGVRGGTANVKLFDFAALCRGLFLKSKRGLLGRGLGS